MFTKKQGSRGSSIGKNYLIIKEDNMEIFYGIMAAVALSVVIMFFQKKKKQSKWSGSVIKIATKEANYNSDPEYTSANDWTTQIFIHYKMDSGKKGKIHMAKQHYDKMYSALKVGDRLIKKEGADFPEIISENH